MTRVLVCGGRGSWKARAVAAEAKLAAVLSVIENGYPGVNTTDTCEHGRYGFEDCIACYDEALIRALSPSPMGAGG